MLTSAPATPPRPGASAPVLPGAPAARRLCGPSDRPRLALPAHLPEKPLVLAGDLEDLHEPPSLRGSGALGQPIHLGLQPLGRLHEVRGYILRDPVGVALIGRGFA